METAICCYKHDYDLKKHAFLLSKVFKLQGFVAVSSYPNDLYERYPWDNIIEWDNRHISAIGSGKKDPYQASASYQQKKIECLYIKEAY